MLIKDTYSILKDTHSLRDAHPVFQNWGYTEKEIQAWFNSSTTNEMRQTAQSYIQDVHDLVRQVEAEFQTSLPGELVLIPSMGEIDGFARYDQGYHTVMLGIDFPGASLDYLKALTAHELSHVFRDHAPDVWGFLGKPIKEVSRKEYLEAMSGREHLVSEGLATLTSQAIFPNVAIHEHHYYELEEMKWCIENEEKIERAMEACLKKSDPNPWQFYNTDIVEVGSPSRVHYYWAARKIYQWIKSTPGMTLVKAHTLHADRIDAF
jgi:hypothetical protein